MIITTPGVPPAPPAPPRPTWPLGREFWCETCGCEFVITEGDIYQFTPPAPMRSQAFLRVNCPTCDKELRFDQESHSYGMVGGMKAKLAATRKRNARKTVDLRESVQAARPAPLVLKSAGGIVKAHVHPDGAKPCLYITIDGSTAAIVEYQGGQNPGGKFAIRAYTDEGDTGGAMAEYTW